MKGQKKKKTEARKLRKQNRKKKQQSFDKWLAPRKANIMSLANELMRQKIKELNKLPRHSRFYCPNCKRLYCIDNDGDVVYCKECWLGDNWVNCAKEVQDTRPCK